MEHSVLGAEEPTDAHLDLASDLPQETVSQEGEDTLSVLTVCSVATEREASLAVPQVEAEHCTLCTLTYMVSSEGRWLRGWTGVA